MTKEQQEFIDSKLYKNTAIWTFCNFGYVEYSLNLYKSLEKLNLENYLIICVTDKDALEFFSRKGIRVLQIKENGCQKFSVWSSDNFNCVTKYKFDITQIFMNLGYNQIYIDGDIVVFENIFDDIICKMKYNIVIQDDRENLRKYEKHCTGFYGIDIQFKTLFLELIDNYQNINDNDQFTYNFNLKKYRDLGKEMNIEILDRNQYPNGAVLKVKGKITEYMKILHFNYIVGHEKINQMKKHNCWYL